MYVCTQESSRPAEKALLLCTSWPWPTKPDMHCVTLFLVAVVMLINDIQRAANFCAYQLYWIDPVSLYSKAKPADLKWLPWVIPETDVTRTPWVLRRQWGKQLSAPIWCSCSKVLKVIICLFLFFGLLSHRISLQMRVVIPLFGMLGLFVLTTILARVDTDECKLHVLGFFFN